MPDLIALNAHLGADRISQRWLDAVWMLQAEQSNPGLFPVASGGLLAKFEPLPTRLMIVDSLFLDEYREICGPNTAGDEDGLGAEE
ncbi:MAG: hypothetical protein OXC26_14385 [Albidovulum sp.]|nr:hypothetical protein [Albidovulum sp.]